MVIIVVVQLYNAVLLHDFLPPLTAWTDDLYQVLYISVFKLP